jgi:pyruvate formate lyase activating enzyme
MSCTQPKIHIKGFRETSFIDWKGHLSSVIFLGGCNLRCPFCHNSDLVLKPNELPDIPVEYVTLTLRKYRKWVDHVVVSGGEPTINEQLYNFLWLLKSEGIKVKLDTNGTSPSILKGLASEGLVDYFAMDFKGPLEGYHRWCGTEVPRERIAESARFIMEGSIDYEFRMTVVPFLHKEEDVYETARYLKHAKRFFVQEFRPVDTLDPSFSTIRPFTPETMRRITRNAQQCLMQRSTEQTRISWADETRN